MSWLKLSATKSSWQLSVSGERGGQWKEGWKKGRSAERFKEVGKGQAQIKLAVTEASGRRRDKAWEVEEEKKKSFLLMSAVKEEILPEHRQEDNFYLSFKANCTNSANGGHSEISKAKLKPEQF